MARIEHYEFGQIVVDAKEERRDLGTPGRRVITADELVSALHSALSSFLKVLSVTLGQPR
jgi:hypothetical protein